MSSGKQKYGLFPHKKPTNPLFDKEQNTVMSTGISRCKSKSRTVESL